MEQISGVHRCQQVKAFFYKIIIGKDIRYLLGSLLKKQPNFKILQKGFIAILPTFPLISSVVSEPAVIHRLPAGIHLRRTGNSLFPMAVVNFPNVIYIIIASKMETLHSTNPTRNLSKVRNQDRLILTLAGIVIALICSLVLLHDTHAIGRVATRLGLGEDSKIVPTDLPLEVKKFEVASAIWLFK